MGEKRAGCDGRVCVRIASGTKHTQHLYHRLRRGAARYRKLIQYGHVIVVEKMQIHQNTCGRKFLFATSTAGAAAALASDRCTDRPLASSSFFPFFFQCYPPSRF